MSKKIVLFCSLLLVFSTVGVLAAEKPADVYLKDVLKQLHLAESFQGEIVTRVHVNDTVLTYQTGILKDGGRADVTNTHSFWQITGTELGRTIRSIPWFYLPPDFSLVQYALPIPRRSTLIEPLQTIDTDYEVKLLKEEEELVRFEMSNGYVILQLDYDPQRNIITQYTSLNAAGQILATVEYVNWKEYFTGVLLPEMIRVRDQDGKILLELVYLNWKVNQGIDGFANSLPSDWNKKVADLQNKIVENPGNDAYHHELALLYKEQKFWYKALEELDKALSLNPVLDYRKEMAQVYEKIGLYQDAINQILVVLESEEQADNYYFLGNLYTRINNPMLAQNAYEKAVKLDGDNFQYLERLFWNYRNISMTDDRIHRKALEVGEKLVELQPENYPYRLYLGDLYLQDKKYNQALTEYETARDLEPEESLPYIKLARYYEEIDRIAEAESAYQDATKVDQHWWNYLQLGDFYLRQAQIEEALAAYESSLQMNPRNTDLNIKLGQVLWQMGREEDAKNYWYQALQFEESNIYTYIRVGEILQKYNLQQEAEDVFQKAIERFQIMGDQSVQPGLSRVYEEIGLLNVDNDPEYALRCFEKSYQHQARSISGIYLGLEALGQGHLNQSIKYWEEAILLDGDQYLPYLYLTVIKGLRGEILGTQNQELNAINEHLSVAERDLLSRFFSYFPTIRALRTEEEKTSANAADAFERGFQAYLKGDLQAALHALEEAIEYDPQYRKGHFFIGVLLSLMGEEVRARTHFDAVQEYYAGSNAARVAQNMNQTIQRLFWK